MNFISHNSQGQYTVLIIFHRKQNWNRQKRGFPQHWYINTFTTGSNSICTKGFYNSTTYSYKPYLIHGDLPPRYNGHELSTTTLSVYHLIMKKCRMQCIQCTPLLGTIHIGPGPQPNCSRVALLWTLLSRALCTCTTRIDVSPCYKILWTRYRHQQQTRVLCSCFITRSTTWRWPI
jgi:hypothetical protein